MSTQRGYIFEASNAWHLRFSVSIGQDALRSGRKRKQRSVKLIGKSELFPTKESVEPIAEQFIKNINETEADTQRCPLCKQPCKRNPISGKFVVQQPTTKEE